MTRLQSRLNAQYSRAVASGDPETIKHAQDAVIGDALYRRNQARMTPVARMIRDQGVRSTAMLAKRLGIDFIDFYVCAFGKMPRFI